MAVAYVCDWCGEPIESDAAGQRGVARIQAMGLHADRGPACLEAGHFHAGDMRDDDSRLLRASRLIRRSRMQGLRHLPEASPRVLLKQGEIARSRELLTPSEVKFRWIYWGRERSSVGTMTVSTANGAVVLRRPRESLPTQSGRRSAARTERSASFVPAAWRAWSRTK